MPAKKLGGRRGGSKKSAKGGTARKEKKVGILQL